MKFRTMYFRIIALPFLTGYTRERCKEPKSKSRVSSAKKQALLLHLFYGPLQESKFGMEMPKVQVVSRYFVAYLASFVAVAPFFRAKVAPFFWAKDKPQTGTVKLFDKALCKLAGAPG